MSLVLTATIPGAKYEFHMLKPGEHFERFGGSRHALIAGRKGALIVREHMTASDQITDTEYNPADRGVWQSIAKWINDTTGEIAADAELPANVNPKRQTVKTEE